MRLVAERSSVPVPRTLWYEPDADPHRLAVLRHGARRRHRPARHHAVPLRLLAVRGGPRRAGPAPAFIGAGPGRAARHGRQRRRPRLPRARPPRRQRPATTRRRLGRLLRMGGVRRRPVAAHRTRLSMARRPLAARRLAEHPQLGRRPHRQHDVPRLRTGGGARLGDGGHGAARGGPGLDDLPPPLSRRPGRGPGAPRDARLHATRRRGRHLRVVTPDTPRRTSSSTRSTPRSGTPSSCPGWRSARSSSARWRCRTIPTT